MEGSAAKSPFFSIVSVSKGRLHAIRNNVDTWLSQYDSEVIVVDYSCPDGTAAWIKANRPRVLVVSVPNRKILNFSEARNLGDHAAQGRYLVAADADVKLCGGFMEMLVSHLREDSFYVSSRRADGLEGFMVIPRKAALEHSWDEEMGANGYGCVDVEKTVALVEAGLKPTRIPAEWLRHLPHSQAAKSVHMVTKEVQASLDLNFKVLHRKHRREIVDLVSSGWVESPYAEDLPRFAGSLLGRTLQAMDGETSRWESNTNGHSGLLWMMASQGEHDIVEIGVRSGGSTLPLLGGLLSRRRHVGDVPCGKMWSCDINPECETWARETLGPLGEEDAYAVANTWRFVHEKGHLLPRHLPPERKVGLVFVDSSHDYETTLQELQAWGRRIEVGGYILGHDIDLEDHEVDRALVDYLHGHPRHFDVVRLHNNMGMFILWKKKEFDS